MQIYFHSCLCSYLPRVPILVEDTVYMKSSVAKASKCHLKFLSKIGIFIRLLCVGSVISL